MIKYSELSLRQGDPAYLPESDDPARDLGTLARIDADAVLRGVQSVRQGKVLALNARVDEFSPGYLGRDTAQHEIYDIRPKAILDDRVNTFHTQGSTQWDGLGHAAAPDGNFFGDTTYGEVISGQRNGMGPAARRGIATRGVLVDLHEHVRARGSFDESIEIAVQVLESAVADASVSLLPGDILLVHTGYVDWYRERSDDERTSHVDPARFACPGIAHGREMVEFLWDSGIAGIATDTPAVEVFPPDRETPFGFLHPQLIGNLGFWLGELWDLGTLNRELRETGRSEFLLTSAPFNLTGAVGSPANAVAVL